MIFLECRPCLPESRREGTHIFDEIPFDTIVDVPLQHRPSGLILVLLAPEFFHRRLGVYSEVGPHQLDVLSVEDHASGARARSLIGSLHGAILVDRLLLRVVARQLMHIDFSHFGSGLELLVLASAVDVRDAAVGTVEALDGA